MAGSAISTDDPALATAEAVALEVQIPRLWWVWLVTGTLWIVAALVILQFDQA